MSIAHVPVEHIVVMIEASAEGDDEELIEVEDELTTQGRPHAAILACSIVRAELHVTVLPLLAFVASA